MKATSWPVVGSSRRRSTLLVVVATYNEKENLAPLLHEVKRYAGGCDFLVVDDQSPDGTGGLADRMARRDPHIRVMHRDGKLGLGTAVVQGLQYGLSMGYSLLMTIDADLSHPPSRIPDLVAKMKDHDLAVASRYVSGAGTENWGWCRRLNSAGANFLLKAVLGLKTSDGTTGFKCYRAELLRRLKLQSFIAKGYVVYPEMMFRAERAGARIAEVPILFSNRLRGDSKLNLGEILGFLRVLIRLRWLAMQRYL